MNDISWNVFDGISFMVHCCFLTSNTVVLCSHIQVYREAEETAFIFCKFLCIWHTLPHDYSNVYWKILFNFGPCNTIMTIMGIVFHSYKNTFKYFSGTWITENTMPLPNLKYLNSMLLLNQIIQVSVNCPSC